MHKLGELRHHASTCTFHHSDTAVPVGGPATAPPAHDPAPAVTEHDKTIADVAAAPVTQPMSRSEHKLLAGLLRRLSHQHKSQLALPIETGGRPTHISFTQVAGGGDVSE